MILLFLALFIFIIYLIHESIVINRRIRTIPLRICVTGIRGKSSVVRLLASILREDGMKIVAKTTGSQALYILPDGEEADVPRKGMPSIIEQKRMLKLASDVNAHCIIVELMSIHPENHYVESQQLLKPNMVIITNVRQDHIEAMGEIEDEIATVLCRAIPKKSTIFIPEKENRPLFQTAVKNAQGELISIREGISHPLQQAYPGIKKKEFTHDIDIIYAMGKHLNISEKVMAKGICKVKHDIGAFKVWEYRPDEREIKVYLVNAFAANDPQSTSYAFSKLKDILPLNSFNLVGLLSLRSDRGDRTLQWIKVLKGYQFSFFNKLYVAGAHKVVVKRKLERVSIIKNKLPEKIMKTIMADVTDSCVIFGFGNIGGIGKGLVEYWNKVGEEYGI